MRTRRFVQFSGLASLALMVVMAASILAADDERNKIVDQKEELKRIEAEVESGKKSLDSLRQAEDGVQKRISGYDKSLNKNRKTINKLNRQLDRVRKDVSSAEEALASRQETYERTRRRYLGNLREFYFATRRPVMAVSDRPNSELEAHRQVQYLTALASYESVEVDSASGRLNESVDRLEELGGQKRKVTRQKKSRETAASLDASRKESQQKKLANLRRKKTAHADRILMLEQAAREMETILARLEQESRELLRSADVAPMTPTVFVSMKGQLPLPFKGKLSEKFGYHVDPVTNLKSFSPGITIAGKGGRKVTAVAAGVVAFVGDLRGYGNFVIVNHDGEHFSTYAGLGETFVSKGSLVDSNARLAVATEEGQVRFELRKGREPLDPAEWITFASN